MKKILIGFMTIMLIVLIGLGGYVYKLINAVAEADAAHAAGNTTNTAIDKNDLGISENAPNEKDTNVINVLLFGLDRRNKNENSRSDAMMIATLDKKNGQLKLTSLMRDMYVYIPGHGKNRLNAAYAFGGPALAIKTINQNFNLNITRYVSVDFFALAEIIDTLGGVEIDVKKSEIKVLHQYLDELNKLDKKNKSPYLKKAGLQTLDGKQAVAYARIRYVGNGDFERTERQRRVLSALFDKVKSINVLKIPDLIADILPYTETNIPASEIISMGTSVLTLKDKEIHQFRVPVDGAFEGKTVNGMSVLVPDIEKNTEMLHKFLHEKVEEPVENEAEEE